VEIKLEQKKCFKCKKTKLLSEFYKHPQMTDGRVNKCKECNKTDVISNRKLKVEYYRKYDRERGNRQDKDYRDEYKSKYPNKHNAHRIVNLSIRAMKLFKEPCEKCGREDVHAHHDDYAKPLNVRWLCPVCHSAWHDKNGSGKNAE
jgi:ribosomal protein S27AE